MSWHILSLTLRAALRAHPPPTEIQSLDSDMQNLVHENYNKFISATDTIRKMKHNVEDMESELHNLIKNMDAMQECSHAVNERLSDQYSKVRAVCGRRGGGGGGQCKRTACGRDVIDVCDRFCLAALPLLVSRHSTPPVGMLLFVMAYHDSSALIRSSDRQYGQLAAIDQEA